MFGSAHTSVVGIDMAEVGHDKASHYNITDRVDTTQALVDNTFTAVIAEFNLNEDQQRMYYVFIKLLKAMLIKQQPFGTEVKDRCMYLGGSSGTKKS